MQKLEKVYVGTKPWGRQASIKVGEQYFNIHLLDGELPKVDGRYYITADKIWLSDGKEYRQRYFAKGNVQFIIDPTSVIKTVE